MKIILFLNFFMLAISQVLAQWELRYPTEPTAGINDIFFLNESVAFAANNSGSILKTSDGGKHWSIVKHFQRDNLIEIKFIDNQNGFIISPHSFIGDSKDFMFTTDGGNFWQSTYIGTSDASTFLPISNSEIIKSGDRGTISTLDNFFGLWNERYRIPQYFDLDIYVPYGDITQFEKTESGRILALGSSWRAFNEKVISDSVSFILFSDNNGNSWDTLWCALQEVLTTFSFADNNHGWMGGEENKIYKSTDGGISWQLTYSDNNPDPTSSISGITAVSPFKIFAVTSHGEIIYSINGGNSWQTEVLIRSDYESFFNIHFLNEEKGFVFGPDLWITTDGGLSWDKVDKSEKPTFTKIQFLDTRLGFGIGGDNFYGGSSFYRTTNGGYNWLKLNQGDPQSAFNGFFMNDSLNGWLSELNKLYKTSNGGYDWNEVYVDTLLEFIRGIEFFDEHLGVLFEVRHRFNNYTFNYVTTDGGTTWNKYQVGDHPFLSSYLKIKRTDPSHIWFVNEQGVWLSGDSAKSFTNISTEATSPGAAFDFLDSLNGWVAHLDAQQNKMKYTTDGGKNWITVMKPYMVQSTDLVIEGTDISGNMQVTVAGLNGTLFRFLEDWGNGYEQTTYTNNWLYSIAAYREGNTAHKWVAGQGGIILYRNEYITEVKEKTTSKLSSYYLYQNYPNPFNPKTNIKFLLPEQSKVSLKVYDMVGKEIILLINEERPAGEHEVDFDGSQLASGVYVYTMQAYSDKGSFINSRKMILMK